MKRALLLAWLAACGDTGGTIVSFHVTAQGADGGAAFDNGLGWHVSLTKATLHIGAVYLNLAVPISGSQATPCILPGVYTAEELASLTVDVLSTAPQAFPKLATGTDDEARTGEIWLAGGDVNAPTDSTVIAEVAGTASKDATSLPFHGVVTISTGNRGVSGGNPALPSSHPICAQRIVTPIPIQLRPREGGTLAVTIDPRAWFSNVDFTALPADGELPDDNTNQASQALYNGLSAAASAFQLSFQ